MGTNYWISSKKDVYGQWLINFPDAKTLDPQQALAFFTAILEVGERERVFRVKQTIQPFPYSELMNHSYAQHLKYLLEEEEKMMFFQHLSNSDPVSALRGGKTLAPTLTPATLCYYDIDGNITEGEVTDMGELLEQLRGAEIDINKDYYKIYPNPPIEISGELPDIHCHEVDLFYMYITLNTDIWLPKVYGDLERSIQTRKGGSYLYDEYDNLELAMCHTPRFNRFLAEVKQLTLEYGGKFKPTDGTGYSDENGIILS